MRPAVGGDFCGILLKPVVVQNVAIGGRIVIATHPRSDEITNVGAISEKVSASDLIHIYANLSRTWQCSANQQSRCYEENIPSHGLPPNVTAGSHSARQPSRSLADCIRTTISASRYCFDVQPNPKPSCGSDS